jgi:predicted RNase H-like HicB family nuclease
LVVPEICFFDTLEEANQKAEEMLEELLGIMQSIAEGLGNGD